MKTHANESTEYKNCNHYHELTDEHEIVDFGDSEFVANKKAMPLLKALNDLGLRTRTHHCDKVGEGFFSMLMDNVSVEIRRVSEVHSERSKYNGKMEILIQWGEHLRKTTD